MREICISIANQTLTTMEDGETIKVYSVSTALNGPGEQNGTGQTPTGSHFIRAKIGDGQPIYTVFRGRRPTGEIYSLDLAKDNPKRDWILTRILWLCGTEIGKNRLGNVDTMARYIYIHGTPDTEPMGKPLSHGCIRMRNDDVIELFDWAPIQCPVLITKE